MFLLILILLNTSIVGETHNNGVTGGERFLFLSNNANKVEKIRGFSNMISLDEKKTGEKMIKFFPAIIMILDILKLGFDRLVSPWFTQSFTFLIS